MSSINPTVGRKVYVFVSGSQRIPFDGTIIAAPSLARDVDGFHLPATEVPFVEATPESLISVFTIYPDGKTDVYHDVPLRSTANPVYPCYDWMPYQKQQASTPSATAGDNASA